MPAQFKHSRDNKKRYSSSSSSPHRSHRDKDSKANRHQKWHKRSRSRSRSSHKNESRYKSDIRHANRDERRYQPRHYDSKRGGEYRKRESSQERREREDYRKQQKKYEYNRNQHRSKERNQKEPKRQERRQKGSEIKRWHSSSSKSSSPSPKRKYEEQKRQQTKISYQKKDERRQNEHKYTNDSQVVKLKSAPQQTRLQKREIGMKDRGEQKQKVIEKEKEVKQSGDISSQTKLKEIKMSMAFPPPPSKHFNESQAQRGYRQTRRQEYKRDNNDYKRDNTEYKRDNNEYKRDNNEYKRDNNQQRRQNQFERKIEKQIHREEKMLQTNYRQRQSINDTRMVHEIEQIGRISPLKRTQESRRDIQSQPVLHSPQKTKVSKFQMIMNEAKTNLIVPPPPVNFMALDTFRNMNKFEVQTLDQKWASLLKSQLQKYDDLKEGLSSLSPQESFGEAKLWTFLKQQRNEQQQQLRLRLQQLRLHTMTLTDLSRKLKVIE